jgi:hypothetical protein
VRSQLLAARAVPVALTPIQQRFLQQQFAAFMAAARKQGIVDQEMCEWLLSLASRWLVAHGVRSADVHVWVEREMRDARMPRPLVAAAAAPNDFGGRRH